MSDHRQQKPGTVCAAKRVYLRVDPLITGIQRRDGHYVGARVCQRCGHEGVTVTRRPSRDGSGRWTYAEHRVPEREPRKRVQAMNPKPRLSEADFEHALAEGGTQEEMAQLLGVNLRTIQRAYDRYRPGQRPILSEARVTPEHRRRIHDLAADGTPASWIAEELPYSYETVLKHARTVPGFLDRVGEWRNVWPSINHNPALLALHYEFTAQKEARADGVSSRENRDHPGVRRMAAAA